MDITFQHPDLHDNGTASLALDAIPIIGSTITLHISYFKNPNSISPTRMLKINGVHFDLKDTSSPRAYIKLIDF